MTVTTKTYNVNKTKQLIDLNGHLTNFKSVFTVKSDKDTEFHVAIVNQNILDSEDDTAVKYRHATGIINGEIFNDNDIYQNYFLIIVSKKPCECEVTVDVNQIPSKRNNTVRENELSEIIEDIDYKRPLLAEEKNSYVNKKKKSNRVWWILFFVILSILIGIGLFYYLKKYRNKKSVGENNLLLTDNKIDTPVTETIPIIETPVKQNQIEQLIEDELPTSTQEQDIQSTDIEKNILQNEQVESKNLVLTSENLKIDSTPSIKSIKSNVKNQTLLDRLNSLKRAG
jgi:hypothetical protein